MSHRRVRTAFLVLWLWTIDTTVRSDYIRTTFGSSGVVCENGGRKCITRVANCTDGTCQCMLGTGWRGDFVCYPTNSYHAEVLNDPNVRTFARDKVALPVTCRYLFSHFRTTFTGWNSSTCEVVVHAYNIKQAGKIFVHGYDLALRVLTLDPDDSMSAEVSFRVFGSAFQGIYTFQERGSIYFRPDGPWEVSEPPVMVMLPETIVRTRYDPYNNFAFMEVTTCGFTIYHRPFDRAYGKDQTLVPGLALSVDPNHEPEWLSLDTVTALVPEGEPSLGGISSESGLDPTYAMLQRFALSGVLQNQPDAAPECTTLTETVRQCPNVLRRQLAFQTCMFILQTSRLIRCLDPSTNGNIILNVFNSCFLSVCLADVAGCQQVQAEVTVCRHILQLPPVKVFLQPETCNNITI